MRVIEFKVEQHGNELFLNGDRLENGKPIVDEKLITRAVPTPQQWQVLAMLRKLTAQLEHAYRKSMVLNGEITSDEAEARQKNIKSGAGGVDGTSLGRL